MTRPTADTSRRALREALRERRTRLDAPSRMRAAEAVAQHLLADPLIHAHAGGYLAAYWAVRGELPLHVLQLKLPPQWIWCLPIVREDRTLAFAPWRPGDALVSNAYGIPEPDLAPSSWLLPEEMHAVLLPLTGFDAAGHRLGTGGGYYDRSFAFRQQRAAPPHLIGVAYACQEAASIPTESWDIPLDAVVTEDGLRRFAG